MRARCSPKCLLASALGGMWKAEQKGDEDMCSDQNNLDVQTKRERRDAKKIDPIRASQLHHLNDMVLKHLDTMDQLEKLFGLKCFSALLDVVRMSGREVDDAAVCGALGICPYNDELALYDDLIPCPDGWQVDHPYDKMRIVLKALYGTDNDPFLADEKGKEFKCIANKHKELLATFNGRCTQVLITPAEYLLKCLLASGQGVDGSDPLGANYRQTISLMLAVLSTILNKHGISSNNDNEPGNSLMSLLSKERQGSWTITEEAKNALGTLEHYQPRRYFIAMPGDLGKRWLGSSPRRVAWHMKYDETCKGEFGLPIVSVLAELIAQPKRLMDGRTAIVCPGDIIRPADGSCLLEIGKELIPVIGIRNSHLILMAIKPSDYYRDIGCATGFLPERFPLD